GIDQLAVDLAGERGLGQAGADGSSDVLNRHSLFVLALTAVGQSNRDHECACSFWRSAAMGGRFLIGFLPSGRRQKQRRRGAFLSDVAYLASVNKSSRRHVARSAGG